MEDLVFVWQLEPLDEKIDVQIFGFIQRNHFATNQFLDVPKHGLKKVPKNC
jgi:hypothetical protein